MTVESYEAYVGFAVNISDVIDENFYIENRKAYSNFYTVFRDARNRAKKVEIEVDEEKLCSQNDFHGVASYFRSNYPKEGECFVVLPAMLADINYAWKKFLKHKNFDFDTDCGLGFYAFYDGFVGWEYYVPEKKCRLIFGYLLSTYHFELFQSENSDNVVFAFKFPGEIKSLLAEFFAHIKTQQCDYKTIDVEQFPIDPDFSKKLDAYDLRFFHSAIKYNVIGSCVYEN